MWGGGCGGALLLLGERSSGSAGLVRDRRGRGYVCGYVCVCVVGVVCGCGCTNDVCRRGCSERENVGWSRSRSGSDVVGSKVRRSEVRILGGSSTCCCCCCCWRCCLRRQVKRLNGFRRRFVSEVGSTVKAAASAAETRLGSDKVCLWEEWRSCAKWLKDGCEGVIEY
jgi:hypothetical protein